MKNQLVDNFGGWGLLPGDLNLFYVGGYPYPQNSAKTVMKVQLYINNFEPNLVSFKIVQ